MTNELTGKRWEVAKRNGADKEEEGEGRRRIADIRKGRERWTVKDKEDEEGDHKG